jgi:hypothetical protein
MSRISGINTVPLRCFAARIFHYAFKEESDVKTIPWSAVKFSILLPVPFYLRTRGSDRRRSLAAAWLCIRSVEQ